MRALTLFVVALVAVLGCSPRRTWPGTKEWIRREFPGVEQVSVDALRRELEAGSDVKPFLLDVREEAEYAVSHLPGALRVDPGSGIPDFVRALSKDTPIVTYCSVGYRSSRLATELEANGFTHVRNLEGSIFEWANRGYPVVRDGSEVREVHPFDEAWGVLLDENLHAYEPLH